MFDRYRVVVVTMRRRFGKLTVELLEARGDDLDPEAARLNAVQVAARTDGTALWRQVFVDDGEDVTPVNAPEAEEEVPDAD